MFSVFIRHFINVDVVLFKSCKMFLKMIGLSKLSEKSRDLRTLSVVFIFVFCVHVIQADQNGEILPKAEIENSDESFAESIWGVYVFSLLGIAAFAIIVGFLLNFLSKPQRKTRTSITNRNHRFQPQQRQQDEQQRNPINQESRVDPIQQQPINPPPQQTQQPYTSQNVTELTRSTYQQSYEYQPYTPPPNEIQVNRFSRPMAPLPPPAEVEQNRMPPPVIGFMVPSSPPPQSQDKPTKQSPYTPAPPSPSLEESIFPKRAVLRTTTPYKIVEEKAKLEGESEDGMDTPTRNQNDGSYNYNNYSYQNDAFSGYPEDYQEMYPKGHINNDGMIDSRFVRVLPRYPPAPPPKPPSAGFHI